MSISNSGQCLFKKTQIILAKLMKELQRVTWGANHTSIKVAPYIKEDIIRIQREIGGPWLPIATPT